MITFRLKILTVLSDSNWSQWELQAMLGQTSVRFSLRCNLKKEKKSEDMRILDDLAHKHRQQLKYRFGL